MEIGLENFYMDLGALRVSELNEGGDIFCSLPPLNDRPMLSKCKCIGNSYHILLSRSAMSS